MEEIRRRVLEFMDRYGMRSDRIDMAENAREFRQEMRRGLNGEGGSLRMIPTYFSPADRIEADRPVLVIDAGGTNLRAASVWFDKAGGVHMEGGRPAPMPGVESEITAEELFRGIALRAKPYLSASDTIAFCFSYTCVPTPERDGIVTEMGKQLKVKGIVGKSLADGLNGALRGMGLEQKRIIVLNDSVSTLLGGALSARRERYSGYIGFILGTGLNASYVERAENIGKLGGARAPERIIVNTEAGNYNRFPRGLLDEKYDGTLMDTGRWQFEKMTAGRYQGGLIAAVVAQAVEDGLFSGEFGRKFSRLKSGLEAWQIDEFLGSPDGGGALAECCSGPDSPDAAALYHIIDEVMERAARLTAVSLAAMMEQAQIGGNPFRPACITGDGSTFYKPLLFRSKLDCCMRQFAGNRLGLYYRFNHVPNVNMVGSAVAGLCG